MKAINSHEIFHKRAPGVAGVLALLGSCSTLALVSPATAQGTEISQLDQIVVTAQKREQNIQQVGVSVTALDGDNLRDMGVSESIGIASQTPNLSIGLPVGEGNQPSIFLRGVGLNDFNTNNSGPIGVYNDEVYLSVINAQNFLLFDLDRVEVLRGPQGTLYGRNTTGGAVKFVSKRPTQELEAYARVNYSTFDSVKFEGALGGPISNSWAGRVSVVKNNSDGHINNLLTSRDANGVDVFGARAQLEGRISDVFNVLLNVHGSTNRSPAPQYKHQGLLADPLAGSPCTIAQAMAGGCFDALGYSDTSGFYDGEYDREGGIDRENLGASLTANLDLGSVTVTSVTSYEYADSFVEEETDASPNRLLNIDYQTDARTFTQELRTAGNGERYNWLAGVFVLVEDLDQNQTVDLFRDLRPLVESIDPVAFPGGFDPVGASPVQAPIFFSRHLGDQDTKTYAVFGQLEYDLTDDLRIILGGRYTNESRDFLQSTRFEEPDFEVPLFEVAREIDNGRASWKVGAEYKLSDDALAYASVSTGFKSGGFNGGFLFDPAETAPYGEETILAYEAGLKTSWFDERMILNAAGFYYDYEDLQIFTLINSGGLPLSVLTNAGNARIYGAEVELRARPAEGLNVQLALGLLDSELQDFVNFGGEDFSGNSLVLSPEVNFSGFTQYVIPLGASGSIAAQTDFNYQSKVFFDTANNPLLSQDAYWLWNARIAYRSPDNKWELAGFVRNIGNEEYFTYAVDLSDFGFNQFMRGMPRVLGVEVSFALN
jgi:iron complex outermembrane recepter protein